MNKKTKKKVALVTGSGTRLGREIALALAEEGIDTVIHFNSSRKEAMETAELVRKKGREAWLIRADLGNPKGARTLFQKAWEKTKGIDFIVNSAAIYPATRITQLGWEEFIETTAINAFSPLVLTRELGKTRKRGAVVNILDARITDLDCKHSGYFLSKRLLYDMTRLSALEFAPRLRVNAVAPGIILPPRGKHDSWLERMKKTNPLKSKGSPSDVARAVLFLVKSPFVTGEVIFVDGGRHLHGGSF